MDHLFPLALEHLPSPTLIVAGNRQVIFANIEAMHAFDIIIGKDLALTFRHPDILNAFDRTPASKTHESGEFSIPGPLAQVFELNSIPISHELGTQSVLLSLQDKTKAARSEEMRVDFVANASHELRSPLSAILGFIEALQGPARNDAEARIRFLDLMGREAERMNRLIEDLLQLSCVEIDEHVRPSDNVNISDRIQKVFEVLGSREMSKGMTFELIGADQPNIIKGDGDQLNQVLRNLIENAIHYGNSDSIIQIALEHHDNMPNTSENGVTIYIKDSSNGIEKRHIPRLTERFYRIDSARTHHAKNSPISTGLGLAIVKHIINRHRGRLKIESEVGVGSIFSIFLPKQ